MIFLLVRFYSKLSLDLVPRVGPLAVDAHKISISSLHQVHVNSSENAKASSVSVSLSRSLCAHSIDIVFTCIFSLSICRVAEHFVVKLARNCYRIIYIFVCETLVIASVTMQKSFSHCMTEVQAKCVHYPKDFWYAFQRMDSRIILKNCTVIVVCSPI